MAAANASPLAVWKAFSILFCPITLHMWVFCQDSRAGVSSLSCVVGTTTSVFHNSEYVHIFQGYMVSSQVKVKENCIKLAFSHKKIAKLIGTGRIIGHAGPNMHLQITVYQLSYNDPNFPSKGYKMNSATEFGQIIHLIGS